VVPLAAQPLAGLDLSRLNEPPLPPDWLVRDLIARRWLVLLGARPGVGKSWLQNALAIAITTGQPWLGHEVPATGRVLVIDVENGDELVLERLYQLGATEDDIGDRLLYVTESLTLPDPAGVARLRATIELHKPDLVVIDTLASVAPSAERDTESASTFFEAVWHLVRDHGAALVLLVHLRKSQRGPGREDPLDSFRGAGQLAGVAHRAWLLEPVDGNDPSFLLHDVKPRRGRTQPSIRVELIDEPDTDPLRTRVEAVGTVTVADVRGYEQYVAKVLAHLATTTLGEARAADLLALPDAPATRTANAHLTRAVRAGVLHKPKRGIYTRGDHAQRTTDHEDPTA
jgi:hypothetical protein